MAYVCGPPTCVSAFQILAKLKGPKAALLHSPFWPRQLVLSCLRWEVSRATVSRTSQTDAAIRRWKPSGPGQFFEGKSVCGVCSDNSQRSRSSIRGISDSPSAQAAWLRDEEEHLKGIEEEDEEASDEDEEDGEWEESFVEGNFDDDEELSDGDDFETGTGEGTGELEKEEDFVVVGQIVGVHGLGGEVRVRSQTDFPEERFQRAGERWLQRPGRQSSALKRVQLVRGRPGPRGPSSWLLRFKGVSTPEKAEELVGCLLLVRNEQRPELEDGEFYSADLVGLEAVLQASGDRIGKVVDVFSSGANDLLRVQLDSPDESGGEGPKAQMAWIPFVASIVPVVDVAAGRVEICPPEGLFSLNRPSQRSTKQEQRLQVLKQKRKDRSRRAAVRRRLVAAGQDHVLALLASANSTVKESLLDELHAVDMPLLERVASDLLTSSTGADQGAGAVCPEPPPAYPRADWSSAHAWLSDNETTKTQTRIWWERGLKLLGEGAGAVLVLAGGQGTRLGSDAPPAKGMLDLGLPSGKSLFQLQAERLRRMQELARQLGDGSAPQIPWIVLTSDATDTPTRDFFTSHDHFGLKASQVWFVKQGRFPCIQLDPALSSWKLMLDESQGLVQAPNGNGGLFEALQRESVLAQLQSLGVRFVQVYAVDNALARVADPVFFGYCDEQEVDVGVKVVTREHPEEAVGVVCLHRPQVAAEDGQVYGVLEYSEMSDELRRRRGDGEDLAFRAAHICNNMFSLAFLHLMASTQAASRLPVHAARKRIPHSVTGPDGSWQHLLPEEPNGYKLEHFIFDAFRFCPPEKLALLEVNRHEEFAPIKNADGDGASDSPSTARALLRAHHRQLALRAGMVVSVEDSFEISPLESYAGEGLLAYDAGKQLALQDLASSVDHR